MQLPVEFPSRPEEPDGWDVSVAEHSVAGRYPITTTVLTVTADNGAQARLMVIRMLHVRAGVPPWKPCIRESWPYTTAVRTP